MNTTKTGGRITGAQDPPRARTTQRAYRSEYEHNGRNLLERHLCHLKQWRRLATRYNKLETIYRAVVVLYVVIACSRHRSDTP